MNYKQLKALFKEPTTEYRGVPFWSWNDDLQQDELDRQVEGFQEQGMGGFMMHVRQGLETPYLGEAFMDRIRDTVFKAKETGMSAWLYDEDRYSSGMGGGKVPALGGDEVRAKALTLTITDTWEEDERTQAVYRIQLSGRELISCTYEGGKPTQVELAPGEHWLVFRLEIAAASEWCHGDTYTDNLNPRSVELFIETTYEVYRQAVGEEFGKTVAGIFTDEPTIRGFSERLHDNGLTWISWTPGLPAYFRRMHGYEIWEQLPYLFFEGASAEGIRHDYWYTITEMFCQAYTRQISEWCRHHGLPFTGHFHSEGSLAGAAMMGGAMMPHYRYLDIPGIDTLCEQIDENLTVKQVASVANQYGRKRVITETYGVTGWGLSFESRKWIGDWQYALGVNLLTHHLSLYSLKGCRKRDYPPSFNYHTNWWEHNHVPEDYYARLSAILSQGRCEHQLLVLHPSTTVWSMLGTELQGIAGSDKTRSQKLENYQQWFVQLIDLLLAEHVEYDLGDELIMQDIGKAEDGVLQIGEGSYTTVLLPANVNLLPSTLELLLAFMDGGGQVLCLGEPPRLLRGRSASELSRLTEHRSFARVDSLSALPATLDVVHPRAVSIRDRLSREDENFLFIRRRLTGMTVIFVVNKNRYESRAVELRLAGSGSIEQWDPLTGEVQAVGAEHEGDCFVIHGEFCPAESRLYVLHDTTAPALGSVAVRPALHPAEFKPYTALGPVAEFKRTAPNALLLDVCQYRIGAERWSSPKEVWRAQKELRERLGMRTVHANGNLQRHLWVHEPHPNDGEPVSFRFQFEVEDVPAGHVRLALEQGEQYAVTLNGQSAGLDGGWYMDRCMKTFVLPDIRRGINELELFCAYSARFELEDAFLLGDFAVDEQRALIHEPDKLRFGDWCLQGYPHYCGSMRYALDVELEAVDSHRYLLELGAIEGVLAVLYINGSLVRKLPWQSEYAVEISEAVIEGRNQIEVEVVGSPRNLLGPVHLARTDDTWEDWWSYRPEGEDYTSEYVLQPYGLMSQIHIRRCAK